jgi:hypothetical protein
VPITGLAWVNNVTVWYVTQLARASPAYSGWGVVRREARNCFFLKKEAKTFANGRTRKTA